MKKMAINYTKSKDYRMVVANGILGFVTEDKINCELYMQKPDLPKEMEIDLDKKDDAKKQVEIPATSSVTRELQIGLSLTPQEAKVIGKWLLDNAERISKELK